MNILKQVLPPEIRRYSVFKGEESLNIFENKDALKDLVRIFSNAKSFDELCITSDYLHHTSVKSLDKVVKKDSTSQKKLKLLMLIFLNTKEN